MIRGNVELNHPERFASSHVISKQKLDGAIEMALDKLERALPKWTDDFAGAYSIDHKYPQIPNNNWVCGMHTGLYWLAYEMSGNPKFREVAEKHMLTYQKRFDNKIGFGDHDVGFVYSPSCVAGYKITKDENLRKLLLGVADYYYNTSTR